MPINRDVLKTKRDLECNELTDLFDVLATVLFRRAISHFIDQQGYKLIIVLI